MPYDISCHPDDYLLLNQKFTKNSKHSTFINSQIFDIWRSTFSCYTFHKSKLIDLAFQPKRSPPTHRVPGFYGQNQVSNTLRFNNKKCMDLSSSNEKQVIHKWKCWCVAGNEWTRESGQTRKPERRSDKLEIWYWLLMIGSAYKLCQDKLPRSSVPPRHLNRRQKARLCFSLCL